MAATGKPRILVVEDDADIRDLLDGLLTDEGYEVTLASDGVDALELVATLRPDLILLDVGLPRLDGPSFCRAYREGDGRAPVLLISAADPTKIDEAVDACGAAGYIAKPFEVDELMATVSRLVGG
jgi:two-component system, OmpR family, response regulator MprA